MVAAKYFKKLFGTNLQRTSQMFLQFVFEGAHGSLAYQNVEAQLSLVYAKCL